MIEPPSTGMLHIYRRELESLLERRIDPAEAGSIPTLNDLNGRPLEEARALARPYRPHAVHYLRFFVAICSEYNAAAFCEEVLRGEADVASWGTYDVLVIASDDDLAVASTERLVARLHEAQGERWWCKRPTEDVVRWNTADTYLLPGVLIRDARYWVRGPSGTDAALMRREHRAYLVPIDDLSIALRRWLAVRITRKAHDYLERTSTPTVSGILEALGKPDCTPTPDAELALRAVTRHAAEFCDAQRALACPDDAFR
jgi:hypothetical protein